MLSTAPMNWFSPAKPTKQNMVSAARNLIYMKETLFKPKTKYKDAILKLSQHYSS